MLRRAQSLAASTVDRLFHKVALSRGASSRARSAAESLGPTERVRALEAVAAYYGEREALLYPSPPAMTPEAVEHVLPDGGRRIDLRWTSAHRSLDPEAQVKLDGDERNARAVARLVLGPERGRPAIVLVHGYLGGQLAFEERAFAVPFLRSRGLDVALAVLPQHGERGARLSGMGGKLGIARPRFPSSDPRMTVEGFRQAILDLRTLVAHLLDVRGASAVGVMGMSLGGYTSALLATVEPRLSFVAPMIPLASIADFARADDRYVGTFTQQHEQHEALERAYASVSPLARPVLVPPAGRLVLGARADRITPPGHAEKLAAHFGVEVTWFHGGHLVQVGRRQGFARLMRTLEALELIPRR